MKWIQTGLVAGFLAGASLALSGIHPGGDARGPDPPDSAILSGSNAPREVRDLLEFKCGDCHSSRTHWPAYSRLAPASWLIERDVRQARLAMNLSHWPDYGVQDQAGMLARIAAEVRNGRMPVRRYLLLHPRARLSDTDRLAILSWTRQERQRLRSQTRKTTQETMR